MKVVQYEGKLYEVVGDGGPGYLGVFLLKSDRTRNKSQKFPMTILARYCTFLDGYHEDTTDAAKRKIQEFIAGLTFEERMILQREVCKK